MSRLEVVFRVGLSHPFLVMGALPGGPLVAEFPSQNRVEIDAPDLGPVPPELEQRGVMAQMVVRVVRECTVQDVQNPSYRTFQDLHIISDAAEAFWKFFAIVRETDFKTNSTVAGYPITPSEEIHNSPMVRSCSLEWSFDGRTGTVPLTGTACVTLTGQAWNEARRRLSAKDLLLPHITFALDAAYYANTDPVRAIIMACASLETALRYFLANNAAKRDPAYLIASEGGNIQHLLKYAKAARGGTLFYDYETDAPGHLDQQRKYIEELPAVRNKVLHQGKTEAILRGKTIDYVLAVLNAIEWLFAESVP